MFGLEILDVVIGLVFVYLLLSLFATALNEYVAAVFNLRGKELAKGLGQLLDDLDATDAVSRARDGVRTRAQAAAESLTAQIYNHRLIRSFATRPGWFTRAWWWLRNQRWSPVRWLWGPVAAHPRLPSYIPARTFALALLDVLGVSEKDAKLDHLIPSGTTPDQAITSAETALAAAQKAYDASANAATEKALSDARQMLAKVRLAQVLAIIRRESSLDLTEHLSTLGGLAGAGNQLAAGLQLQVAGLMADAQTQLQKLHDGVEVWFNNAMDRVSGAYKRTAQGWLFGLGLLIASCMNADTIDMWRRLESDDALRAAMVRRAEAAVAPMDSVVADSAAAAQGGPAATPATPARDTARNAVRDTAQATVPAPAPAPGQTLPPASGSQTVTLQSEGANPATRSDTAGGDSAKLAAVRRARANYQAARARLDSMELKLGWTLDQALEARVVRKDSAGVYPRAKAGWPRRFLTAIERGPAPHGYHADLFPFDTPEGWFKLLGLLLTAVAISLGAPFWFDLLNRVISIRAAGRSPEERPKPPEGGPKRIAERAPK